MNLQLGKTSVVVGGASGIGLATAELFAEEGCAVAVWDLQPVENEKHHGLLSLEVDVCDEKSIASALATTVEQFTTIDHLVIAAATGSGTLGMPFTRVPLESWTRVLDVNVRGLANIAHAVSPLMIESRSGSIVNVASVAGQIGSPTDPPYSASKAAGINFAQCMARDLAQYQIRVNTVCPGMVRTPLNRSVWQSWRDSDPNQNVLNYDDWAQQKIESLIPLGNWQTAQDVADMIVFLSSNRCRQVTGQTINVDGGYVMHW